MLIVLLFFFKFWLLVGELNGSQYQFTMCGYELEISYIINSYNSSPNPCTMFKLFRERERQTERRQRGEREKWEREKRKKGAETFEAIYCRVINFNLELQESCKWKWRQTWGVLCGFNLLTVKDIFPDSFDSWNTNLKHKDIGESVCKHKFLLLWCCHPQELLYLQLPEFVHLLRNNCKDTCN